MRRDRYGALTGLACVLGMMMMLIGCEAPTKPLPPIVLSPTRSGESITTAPPPQTTTLATEPQSQHYTADRALAHMATMPPVGDLRIQQEILLHAAMYRAAYESNIGRAGRYLIDPVREEIAPDLGVEPADFRLRVLAELADLGVPVAWVPATWQTQAADLFPGTGETATRLSITISRRDEDHAAVIGEISDRTAGAGGSRQGVTATWDGLRWNIDRDPVRVVW